MKRALILFALALSAFTAGCQTAQSPSAFPCTSRLAEWDCCGFPPGGRIESGRALLGALIRRVRAGMAGAFRLKFPCFER